MTDDHLIDLVETQISQLSDHGLSHIDLSVVHTMPLSDRSKELIAQVGKEFKAYLEQDQAKLNWDTVRHFLLHHAQQSGPLKPNSFNSKKYAVKKLLLAQDSIQRDPYLKVAIEEHFKSLKSAQVDVRIHEEDYLSQSEITQIIDFCFRGKDRPARIGILIQALFETGCRVSELIHIRLNDLTAVHQSEASHYRIRIVGKGKKERMVFLKEKTFKQAEVFFKGKTFLFESEDGTALFRNNVFRSIQRMAKRAGIEKSVHPHTLRHSCAMHLLKTRKLNAKAVSEYLGHSDVSITLKSYIHDMPTAEDVFGEQ